MKGSEQRARRLHAKPEALKARGKALDQTMQDVIAQRPPIERGRAIINGHDLGPAERDTTTGRISMGPQVTERAREHGTGDVARENAERIARIAAADALLGEAVGTATRAWTDIAHVVGASHPAAMGAQLTRENAERARVITKQLLRALGRAL